MKALTQRIRSNSLRMVHHAKASHIGSALSCVDIIATLYSKILRSEDCFILSKGHAAVALYSTLAEMGTLPFSLLNGYGDPKNPLCGHTHRGIPGIEFSSGSLGHGLPLAVGKAIALRRKGAGRVYVLCGDGEMGEGSNWEALLFASHHKLSNLTLIIDYNNLQSIDTVENTLSLQPFPGKLAAFGCSVIGIDGHDFSSIEMALSTWTDKPMAIIAQTTKGKGVSFMENKVEWHYKSPTDAQLILALEEIENA